MRYVEPTVSTTYKKRPQAHLTAPTRVLRNIHSLQFLLRDLTWWSLSSAIRKLAQFYRPSSELTMEIQRRLGADLQVRSKTRGILWHGGETRPSPILHRAMAKTKQSHYSSCILSAYPARKSTSSDFMLVFGSPAHRHWFLYRAFLPSDTALTSTWHFELQRGILALFLERARSLFVETDSLSSVLG